MTDETETGKYHQRLSAVLNNSKETDLNGETPNAIHLGDITITVPDLCPRCGKPLHDTSAEVGERQKFCKTGSGQTLCEGCTTEPLDVVFTFSPEFDEEVNNSNKRDSGFHTLKREESNKMDTDRQAESALSSASSADSAVSVECNGNGEVGPKSGSKKSLPSIVLDLDDGDEQNGLDLPFSPNEGVFQDEGKLHPNGTEFNESPKTLAEKLFNLKGYKRTEIASKLGENTDFSHNVGVEYLKFFDFTEFTLIGAYRDFLSHFALLGETQERERILCHFSKRYVDCNPDFLDGKPDSVHTLVCALTLLNTDLHGNVGLNSGRKKMTCKQFVTNLSGLKSDKGDFPKDLLSSLYSSVKKTPLPWGGKEQRKLPRSSSMRQDSEMILRPTPTKIVNRSLSTRSPAKARKSIPNGSSSSGLGRSTKLKSLSHNQGLLWRKALVDSEGKKVALGKRGWKVYTVALQNLELHVAKRGSTEAKTISLHHSLAEESDKDSKRQHIFRLTLANTSVTLYQASSEKESRKWIREINKAAALLSAAPLCSPIGSQLVFRRPLLPSAPSTLPMTNQYEKLQELLKEHEEDLDNTRSILETEKSRPEQSQYYEDKIVYLQFEIKKYKRYVKDLQILMRASSVMSDTSESNLESTDNGSLVSVTPSEPPLASPMHRDSFHFQDSDDSNPPPSTSEPTSSFSSPAHLVSPQHKNLTLSPTSSLPNLSPIMESPSKALSPSGSGRRRQRKENNLYESSLNDSLDGMQRRPGNNALGVDSPEKVSGVNVSQGNTNNSNHVTSIRSFPAHVGPSTTYGSLPRVRRLAESSLSGNAERDQNFTPYGYTTTSLQRHAFEVKRYEMRVASMGPHSSNLVSGASKGAETGAAIYSPHGTPPSATTSTAFLSHEQGLAKNTVLHLPATLKVTPTLTRVKGRKERKGIERYSYMLAVGDLDES